MKYPLIAILTVLMSVPSISAQDETGDAIVFYSAGIDAMLPSTRDASLRRALELIDDRLMELPQELDQPEVPDDAISTGRVIMQMLLSPMNLRVAMIEDAAEGQLPISAQLMIRGETGEQVEEGARTLLEMLLESGMPAAPRDVPDRPGMKTFDVEGVTAYLGSMDTEEGPALVAAVNRLDELDPSPPDVGMPQGIEPVIAMVIDGEKLAPLVEAALAKAPPQEAQMIRLQMAMYGLSGDSPMSFEMGYGYDGDLAHSVLRYRNYLTNPMYRDLIVREPLRPQDMAMVPADALYAQVSRADLSKYPELVRSAMKMGGPDMDRGPTVDAMLQGVADMTGVHPEHDLFAHLGTATGYYTSRSTGGGGLGSLVGFIELKNPADFQTSLDMLAAFLNQFAEGQARGYVKIQTRKLNGQQVTTLSFPGLPVPLEPSWIVHRGYLLAAATPQALIAAMEQAEEGGSDLRQARGFRELTEGRVEQAMSVIYGDTEELAARGYGLASLGMSALANALQSPRGVEGRDPGLIMPTYSALLENVQPSVTVYRLEGDDLILEGTSDPSALVNLSAIAGLLGGAPTMLAVGSAMAGAFLPALGEARGSARQLKAMTQLRNLATVLAMYAADNADRLPEDLQALIDGGYMTEEGLRSAYGPVSDGGGDYWLNTSVEMASEIEGPERYIQAYDRASYTGGDGNVLVLFGDGHVEALEMGDFFELTEEPQHEGIDFNLPQW